MVSMMTRHVRRRYPARHDRGCCVTRVGVGAVNAAMAPSCAVPPACPTRDCGTLGDRRYRDVRTQSRQLALCSPSAPYQIFELNQGSGDPGNF